MQIISILNDAVKSHFTGFNDIALLVQFVASLFKEINFEQLATCIMHRAAIELEIITLQNNLALKSLVSNP